MPANTLPEYIRLSELIEKIKDKEYYCVFAKTLLMTVAPDNPIPKDEELVKEMFLYFIEDQQLEAYRQEVEIEPKIVKEAAMSTTNWDNDVFVKVKDLKKLYANKCIVLPNSLFLNKQSPSDR